MAVLGDPAIHDPRDVADSRHEHHSADECPPFAAMDQDSSDTPLSGVDSSLSIDELNCPLTFLPSDSIGAEIQPLPWLARRVTANTSLDESHTRRAKGAIPVVDQYGDLDWFRIGLRVRSLTVDHISILPPNQDSGLSRNVVISNGRISISR
jgi:hypothetical protein